MTYLQFEFPYAGPWGADMAARLEGLAHQIAAEEGLTWKIWTENRETGHAGGIYQFRDREAAEAYRRKYLERLERLGIRDVATRFFETNTALSRITRAPI